MADSAQPIDSESPERPSQCLAARGDASLVVAHASRRTSELALILGFLFVITAVPVTQTLIELKRGERVQFTDVLRYRPTAKALRQYEHTLEEKSWFQRNLRPLMQRLLFTALRDTGAKGMMGREDWLFYRPDVRYLVDPNRTELDPSGSKWVRPTAGATQRESVVRAIVRFRDQLNERGIKLVVVPVPGKPAMYPDRLTAHEPPFWEGLRSPTLELIDALRQQDVPAVNLYAEFRDARRARERPATDGLLYLARDTHWTPLGARLAAQAVAARLRELGLAPAATKQFTTQRAAVHRWGDVLDMMQIPGLRAAYPPERVECDQVLDPALGPLVPGASDRPGAYRYPGPAASVLVLGDSFSRIYQYPEPRSLGELAAPAGDSAQAASARDSGMKRLLPGSAGFISHLALALMSPVDAIVSDGGASTDVRRKLSTNPEILEGKQVVIWEFVERDIALGQSGWEDVALPATLN